MEENPSAAKDREVKQGKASERKSSSAGTRQDIQMRFSFINPQMPLESHGKVRILPKSIRPPTSEPSEGVQILANSGLRNCEVCK